jgi:hypothetical protein
LGDILGEMRIASDLPERGGINQIHVPFHQFREGVFRIGPGKVPEKFGIGGHAHSLYSTRQSKNRTGNLRRSFEFGRTTNAPI